MNTRNPQDIREGDIVVFLSNPDAGTYEVLQVWSTGKVDFVTYPYGILVRSCRARDLVQAEDTP